MKKIFLFLTAITCVCLISNISNAQSHSWIWAKSAGAVADDQANSIAVDASGNTYVAGWFDSGTITFGTNTLTNAGAYDIFLTKYDASGNVLWAKRAGGTNNDYANSVTIDSSGNVYVAGEFTSDTARFGSFMLLNSGATDGTRDLFLAKYDANGNELWVRSATGLGNDVAYSVAVDVTGNAFVCGSFTSFYLTFGTTMLTNSNTTSYTDDIFLAKYNSSGTLQWAKSAGSTAGWEEGFSVAVDASGNPYVAGGFKDINFTYGTTTLTNCDNTGSTYDIFLAKYNTANGNLIYAKSAGGINDDYLNSVKVDASGNIYLGGYFYSPTLAFGTDTVVNTDNVPGHSSDIFLAKYNSSGNVVWAKGANGDGDDAVTCIAVNASGVYITGSFASPQITFGSTPLTNDDANYYLDAFITKYDASGNVLWAKSAGGSSDEYCFSIAADASNNTYIAGSFYSPTVLFGTSTLTNADNTTNTEDIFVAKLSGTVGINEYNNSTNISLFPNPASDNIIVKAPKNAVIEILNIEGQTVLQQISQQEKTNINISNLAKGIYILKLNSNNKIEVARFVKE